MLKPDYATAGKLAKNYSVIPVCREILGDSTTPIAVLKRLAAKSSRYFLLESVEGGEKWGRYSFLGCDPKRRIFCQKGKVKIQGQEGAYETTEKPLKAVRKLMKKYKAPVLPDFDLFLFDKVIAYDHLKQRLLFMVNIKTDDLEKNYRKAEEEIDKLQKLLEEAEEKQEDLREKMDFQCTTGREEYYGMVEKTREHIRRGDIFQAVISRQFQSPMKGSLLNSYRLLRTSNPSPYMVYFHTEELELMSTSPETLVKLHNGKVTTFPVAGSRPRGKNEEEDRRLEKELLQDEKELSEHNMLVDLGRNDLGKICRFGSVKVTEYMAVHKYSKIMHICSQVEGVIREDKDALDAIEAVLPAGTLSGAPKIRACQIIEELEKEERGIYGGALGYLDFTGNMDTCIAIRMAVKKDQKVYVQAGGGIVADSIPEKEYEESANKAAAVIQAIIQAEEEGI